MLVLTSAGLGGTRTTICTVVDHRLVTSAVTRLVLPAATVRTTRRWPRCASADTWLADSSHPANGPRPGARSTTRRLSERRRCQHTCGRPHTTPATPRLTTNASPAPTSHHRTRRLSGELRARPRVLLACGALSTGSLTPPAMVVMSARTRSAAAAQAPDHRSPVSTGTV